MAPEKSPSFVNVDELMAQLTVEQVAGHYGATLPEIKRVGTDIRMRCFLHCGKTHETGDRAIAMQADHPAKQWRCFEKDCGKAGNLITICHLLKPGGGGEDKPRGQRFKDIAADLKAILRGDEPLAAKPASTAESASLPVAAINVPLKDSPNERARSVVDLDRKFVIAPAQMTPKASAYFRRRGFLTPEQCARWRMGFLPRDVGGDDKSGGTMRGKIVYPILSEAGDVLTWFGRDPEWEDRHAAWQRGDRSDKEPAKFHVVKGFQLGLELFGQHRLREESAQVKMRELGLILVEGPNDVVRLDALGVPAVALCGSSITREQADKASRLARELGNGIVTIFLDCDLDGEQGMKQALGYLAQLTPVRLAWNSKMHGGKFAGKQPESVTMQDWQEIEAFLRASTKG